MALSVDIMHGCGSSSKMCPQLHLKKIKVTCITVDIVAKGVLCAVHCYYVLKRLNMVFAIDKTRGHGLSNKMRP